MPVISIPARVGQLEACVDWFDGDRVAVLCHPNPTEGGSMTNKVVTTLYRFFKQQHISVIAFNFRGTGNSSGQFDHGRGEQDDLADVLSWLAQQHPARQLILAGFSFGAYVVAQFITKQCIDKPYDTLEQHTLEQIVKQPYSSPQIMQAVSATLSPQSHLASLDYTLKAEILIAPALAQRSLDDIQLCKPHLVIFAQQDELTPIEQSMHWAQQKQVNAEVIAEASHFFHGKLTQITQLLNNFCQHNGFI